jgi:hypothetical protein
MIKGGDERKNTNPGRASALGKARASLEHAPAPAYDPAAGERSLAQMRPALMALPGGVVAYSCFTMKV